MSIEWNCPFPQTRFDRIIMGHGGGGRLTHELLNSIIGGELGDSLDLHGFDAGFMNFGVPRSNQRYVFTTDSFVVDPLFFPGGDIGKLSVVGTVNDIAMMGGEPKALSLAFILEEGFLIDDFQKVLRSIAKELKSLDLKIVCGDTKVVPKGKGDLLYINTSAVGLVDEDSSWIPNRIQEGDRLIVSRDIGAHGAAILCARNQLGMKSAIKSDCQELLSVTRALKKNKIDVHCARDLTRGGLMAGAVELAMQSRKDFELIERSIPRIEGVESLCELLGLDPFSMANEGTALFVVAKGSEEKALEVLKSFPFCKNAAVIGQVVSQGSHEKGSHEKGGVQKGGRCHLRLRTGSHRLWSLPEGEMLPRIC